MFRSNADPLAAWDDDDWDESDEPEWFEDFCNALDELEPEDEQLLESTALEALAEAEQLEARHDRLEAEPTEQAKYRKAASKFIAAPAGPDRPVRLVPPVASVESARTQVDPEREPAGELSSLLTHHRSKARMAKIAKRRPKCSV